MRIAVTGSIATDHLMTFSGRFSDSLLDGELETLSVSFLVDDLSIFRGGVAGNISFGLGQLGLRPVLVGAVGQDFADYRAWLQRHNVDTSSIHVAEDLHTARFVCTTDSAANQIASFYPGAMSAARHIELEPIAARLGGIDLVVIAPNDPEAMRRHTEECRVRGYSFAADPSQQLAFLDGESIRELITGADYLFTNEYEAALTQTKTGWSSAEIAQRVGVRVTTLGAKGAQIDVAGEPTIWVSAVPGITTVDPTGVGDAFRAGFLAGVANGLQLQRCAELGSLLAAEVLATNGTQEYRIDPDQFLARCEQCYGERARAQIAAVLG